MNKLVRVILTASLIFMFSEAVLSCSPVEGTGDEVHANAVAMLQAYHWPTVGLGVGVLLLFLLRRFKGIVILLFAVAALALSPGWSPDKNAMLNPACEPIGLLGVRIVSGVVALCFIGQLAFWIVERRKLKQ